MNDSIRRELAKNLAYYRKRAGLNQKQLAEILGVKYSAVSNWETGRNAIDVELLFKVCDILHASLYDMYGRYYGNNAYSAHEHTVICAYRANPIMQPAVDCLLGIAPECDGKATPDDTVNTKKELPTPLSKKE